MHNNDGEVTPGPPCDAEELPGVSGGDSCDREILTPRRITSFAQIQRDLARALGKDFTPAPLGKPLEASPVGRRLITQSHEQGAA